MDTKNLAWALGGVAVGAVGVLLIQGNKISDLWAGIRQQTGTAPVSLPAPSPAPATTPASGIPAGYVYLG